MDDKFDTYEIEFFGDDEPYVKAEQYEKLLQAYEFLRDSVVIIEEGSEPEVGDLCFKATETEGFYLRPFIVAPFDFVEMQGQLEKYRIVERNGKPCVIKPREVK